jgi:endonuclease/exonuclease/phosphatase family metal-dependent hydrolase
VLLPIDAKYSTNGEPVERDSMTEIGPDKDELRILHWNIHSWLDTAGSPNLESVIDLIQEINPHVVSLVEVDEPWGMPSCLAELASRCGYSWIFSPVFEFDHETAAGGFGNALLTRLPISAVQQWRLVSPAMPYDRTEASEPRSVILAKLRFGDESFWAGSTHLPRSDSGARAHALRRLISVTGRLDGRWIVCGDFNAPPSPWPDGSDPVMVCPDPARPTYPAGQPTEPIDYCLASRGMSLDGTVLPTAGSDHLPLVIFARFTRQEALAADGSRPD